MSSPTPGPTPGQNPGPRPGLRPDPQPPIEPDIAGLVAVCAAFLGLALLFIDHRAGDVDHRGLLLVIGLVSLGVAVLAGVLSGVARARGRQSS